MVVVSGIYILRFKNTDKVYIGKSKHINKRFKEHLYLLKNNMASIKLQEAYVKYGTPSLEVLIEEDDQSLLDSLEREAIEIFDSMNNGLNSTLGGTFSVGGLGGLNSPVLKYSEDQIIYCLDLLINPKLLKYKDISTLTGISEDSIRDISSGRSHIWLKSSYPKKYATLEKMKELRISNRRSIGSITNSIYKVISPYGKVFSITNITAFAKEQGLERNRLGKLLRGSILTYKGWKVYGYQY